MLLDAMVGIGFVGVALGVRRAPLAMRVWWGMVGATWWLGGIESFRLVHQGVLIGALASVPSGRSRSLRQYVTLGIGAVVATGLFGQAGAAVGFLATAGTGGRRGVFVRLVSKEMGERLTPSTTRSVRD